MAKQKTSTSKIIVCILAVVAIVGAVVGIAIALNNKPGEIESIGGNTTNPWTQYDSLENLNSAFGVNLQHPGAMGISNESFTGMDRDGETMAQYRFTIAGYEYNLRASKTITGDLSGIHVGEKTLLDGQANDVVVTKGGYKGIQWKIGNVKYSLTVEDDGKISAEDFKGMADEIKSIQQ